MFEDIERNDRGKAARLEGDGRCAGAQSNVISRNIGDGNVIVGQKIRSEALRSTELEDWAGRLNKLA